MGAATPRGKREEEREPGCHPLNGTTHDPTASPAKLRLVLVYSLKNAQPNQQPRMAQPSPTVLLMWLSISTYLLVGLMELCSFEALC